MYKGTAGREICPIGVRGCEKNIANSELKIIAGERYQRVPIGKIGKKFENKGAPLLTLTGHPVTSI